MVFYTVSIDSGTPEQVASVRAEMEQALGLHDDPLIILIAEEEIEFNSGLVITKRHITGVI